MKMMLVSEVGFHREMEEGFDQRDENKYEVSNG